MGKYERLEFIVKYNTIMDTQEPLQALSVDDEKINLTLLEEMGSRLDLEVKSFTDPQAALRYLEAERVDLLFIDYMMPVMDGITFIRRAREFIPTFLSS